MSEGFEIPPETGIQIESLFPESTDRRKIAFTLMYWNKKPNTKEQDALAEAVGKTRNVTYKVLLKIMDAGLFTEELGSVPLYRYNEKLRMRASMEDRLPIVSGVDKTNKGIIEETEEAEETEPPIQPAEKPVSDTKQDTESPPITVESPSVSPS